MIQSPLKPQPVHSHSVMSGRQAAPVLLSQHMAGFVSLIIFGCFHESLMVILDLDFETELATSAFYLASVSTVLRGKDVATGSQSEKKT